MTVFKYLMMNPRMTMSKCNAKQSNRFYWKKILFFLSFTFCVWLLFNSVEDARTSNSRFGIFQSCFFFCPQVPQLTRAQKTKRQTIQRSRLRCSSGWFSSRSSRSRIWYSAPRCRQHTSRTRNATRFFNVDWCMIALSKSHQSHARSSRTFARIRVQYSPASGNNLFLYFLRRWFDLLLKSNEQKKKHVVGHVRFRQSVGERQQIFRAGNSIKIRKKWITQ